MSAIHTSSLKLSFRMWIVTTVCAIVGWATTCVVAARPGSHPCPHAVGGTFPERIEACGLQVVEDLHAAQPHHPELQAEPPALFKKNLFF